MSVSTSVSILEKLSRAANALTASQVGELLSLHKLTIYRLAKSGRIPCYRIAGSLRFDPRGIADYLRAHEVGR